MEKNQYKLCLEVLRRLNGAGVLEDVILIGSWCIPFYQSYFSGTEYSSTIRTRDIDFLVPHPRSVQVNVNIPDLLKNLGFIIGYRGAKGYIKLEHPDLTVEFLSPERGKGTNKPIPIPKLGVNAVALRFLNLLTEN
ncbi:MAG: GSU2403 family nucleotidyltransferase fold protein, partial [Candidatus Omnitrophota bacterium]